MPQPLHRKTMFPFHYSPGERTVHIVANLSDEPGTLASLLAILRTKVNLVGTTSYSTGDGSAIFSGIGKVISSSDDASSIQELVRISPEVNTCEVWESKQGLLVDRFHTGFKAGADEPYLMFPTRAMSETFEGIVRTFGSGGSTILYEQGLDYAQARAGLYKRMMGPHPETRIDELTAIVGALGYGSSIASFDPSRKALKLTCRECFECSTPTETGRTCSFLRGMAVGIFSSLFDKELECEETKCRQKGKSECEFVLTSKNHQPLF